MKDRDIRPSIDPLTGKEKFNIPELVDNGIAKQDATGEKTVTSLGLLFDGSGHTPVPRAFVLTPEEAAQQRDSLLAENEERKNAEAAMRLKFANMKPK